MFSRAKQFLKSKTIWGIVATLVTAGAPLAAEIAKEKQDTGKIDYSKVILLVSAVAGAGVAVNGRVTATERLYTPEWMPGPNRNEFLNPDDHPLP